MLKKRSKRGKGSLSEFLRDELPKLEDSRRRILLAHLENLVASRALIPEEYDRTAFHFALTRAHAQHVPVILQHLRIRNLPATNASACFHVPNRNHVPLDIHRYHGLRPTRYCVVRQSNTRHSQHCDADGSCSPSAQTTGGFGPHAESYGAAGRGVRTVRLRSHLHHAPGVEA